jgi:hypothetical protein
VIALVENNPRALQSNSAAVSRRFSDGNVPLNGQRKPRPTIKELREYLDYDPYTGALWWKKARGSITAGASITGINSRGYAQFKFNGYSLVAHRVVFALHHGHWPQPCCDHINGIKTDNRVANLRECTPSENQHNRAGSNNTTTGIKGVRRDKGGYLVRIYLNNIARTKWFHLLEDAAAYAKQLREQLHGEFARH